MPVSTLFVALPYSIKKQREEEIYKDYITKSLRLLTENTYPIGQYYSSGKFGSFITTDFSYIIKNKKEKEKEEQQAKEGVCRIKNKLRGF